MQRRTLVIGVTRVHHQTIDHGKFEIRVGSDVGAILIKAMIAHDRDPGVARVGE